MSLAAFMGGVVALHYFPQHRYLFGENKETECWACLGVFERGLEEYMGPLLISCVSLHYFPKHGYILGRQLKLIETSTNLLMMLYLMF